MKFANMVQHKNYYFLLQFFGTFWGQTTTVENSYLKLLSVSDFLGRVIFTT